MADENLSGVPPSVTLSGLSAGAPGIGGTAAPGISGAPGQGGQGGFLPGMEGGLDLAQLLQALQAGDTSGIGSVGDINQSLAAGSFGQQQGGLSAQSFGQTQPGYVAGQSSAGGNPAMQAAAGSADPFSVIQKFLGVAARGAQGLQGALTASPTQGGSGATGGEQQAFTTGIASPVNEGQDLAQSGLFQGGLGGTSSFSDPTLDFLFTSGALNGLGQGELSQLQNLPPDQLAGLKTALLGGETQSDLGTQLLGGQSGASGFTLGTGGLDTSLQPAGQTPDFLGGGVGLLQGLMNLYGGAQSGNAGSLLGGAGSTLSGINQLAPGMGFGAGGEALGLLGGGANAPFAALSLANAVDQGDPGAIAQGLASLYGTTVPVINAVFGTSLPTLTSLAASALSSLGGTIGGSVGGALGSLGGVLGGGAAAGAGAAGAGAAGAAGGAGAAGSAAGAAIAAPAAMLIGPYIVAKLIQAAQAMGPDKENARELGIRVKNIYGQLPGELQTLQTIPGISSQLTADSTPEQAAGLLKQLNAIQQGFQEGGWESHMKSGATRVESVGDESGGQGMEVDLPEVQKSLLKYAGALFPTMDITRLRAQDLLSRAGWTPEQIQAQTGRYISPQEWAINLGRDVYNSSEQGNLGSGGGSNSSRWNPYMQENFANPGIAADQAAAQQAQLEAFMRAANGESVNFANPGTYLPQSGGGQWTPAALAAFQRFKPGYTEQGLNDLFGGQFAQAYNGMGLGQGLLQQAGVVPPQLMAAANSPTASTAGAAPSFAGTADGRMTEETLMDLLRRMSPGAAYAGV